MNGGEEINRLNHGLSRREGGSVTRLGLTWVLYLDVNARPIARVAGIRRLIGDVEAFVATQSVDEPVPLEDRNEQGIIVGSNEVA